MLLFALTTVVSRNPIHSILSLIGLFVVSAFMMILVGAEFLAYAYIIVYVGAIAVLFLFIIMMINVKSLPPVNKYNSSFLFLCLTPVVILYFFWEEQSLYEKIFLDYLYYSCQPEILTVNHYQDLNQFFYQNPTVDSFIMSTKVNHKRAVISTVNYYQDLNQFFYKNPTVDSFITSTKILTVNHYQDLNQFFYQNPTVDSFIMSTKVNHKRAVISTVNYYQDLNQFFYKNPTVDSFITSTKVNHKRIFSWKLLLDSLKEAQTPEIYEIIAKAPTSFLEFYMQYSLYQLFRYNQFSGKKLWIEPISNIQALGQVIYLNYAVPFILCGIALFISMIGAITLTKYYGKKNYDTEASQNKYQTVKSFSRRVPFF